MMDLINAAFELLGAIFILPSVLKLLKEKTSGGVHWISPLYFTSWGVWNVVFYPATGNAVSGIVAIGCVAANGSWLYLAWKYR